MVERSLSMREVPGSIPGASTDCFGTIETSNNNMQQVIPGSEYIFFSLPNQKDNDTRGSQAVSHPSTNLAQHCLTSVIGRELVFSMWYGRCQRLQQKLNFFSNFFTIKENLFLSSTL